MEQATREVVESSSLETFRKWVDTALRDVVSKCSVDGLMDDPRGLSQP